MDDKQKQFLVDRVKAGESMQAVAYEHGISRERVRQICLEFGVTGASVRVDRRNAAIEADAPGIIGRRQQWIPARFSKRPYTQAQFEEHLAAWNIDLYTAWREADKLPVSKTGHADPQGQRCSDCHQWQAWDRFYGDRSRPYGKSSRCIPCAKKNADETRRKRNVIDATVERKRCNRCERRLAATKFYRSTTSTNGLQQYCKECQREYERDRRSRV